MREFLKSKIATALLLVVVVFLGSISVRMFVRKIEVDKEINKLKAQADRIQKDTDDLSSLIKYLNTPEYAEREAREKLNLKKEGEFVVVLQTQENVAGANAGLEKEPSNPQKWLEYFFKP